jgi:hypothetical protein
MTNDQDFKALVRARMAKTGESYATARTQLRKQRDAAPHTSGLACGRCGEPITDADAYRVHLEQVHGRKQPRVLAADGVVTAEDRKHLVGEFDAAIDILEAALRDCPDELWEASMWHVPRTDPWVWPVEGTEPIPERTDESIQEFSAFWVIAYHCLWFLDFYVSTEPGFESPDYVRGGPEEMAWPADGAAPFATQVFSRDVLLKYADHGRRRVRERIQTVPDDEFEKRCHGGHPHAGTTLLQLLKVNLAHVREHGTQLADLVEKSR